MNKTKIILPLLAFIILTPNICLAETSGEKADDVQVKVYFKRSPEWKDYVKVLAKKTTSKGVLEAENVPEGWYKMEIAEKDERSNQRLAVRLKVLTKKGQYVRNAKVKLYAKVGDAKIFVTEIETDERGWFEKEGLISGHEYYIEINAEGNQIRNFSEKSNQPRIKAKAKKIGENKGGEKWIWGLYTQTDENQILDVKKIQEGYYKFDIKEGDKLPLGFFNVRAQILDPDAKEIKKPTKIKLYAYPNDMEVFAGEITTSANGEIFLPKLVLNMKYRLDILD